MEEALAGVSETYASIISSTQFLLLLVNILIHMAFAGAVAKDAGRLVASGEKTMMVSGVIWAFVTLVGGVYVAAIYWLIHHSKLTRN